MKVSIACIGSGNMGTALMKGAAAFAGTVGFTDIERAKAEEAAARMGGVVYASNTEAVAGADVVFLAVKPQILKTVLAEIAPALAGRVAAGNAPLVVSMAPGWTIEKIQDGLGENGGKIPVARIMPNTPALVSRGVLALTFSSEVSGAAKAMLTKILEPSGLVETIPETYFDAVTGLSGSGPAFVYLFIEALADGGVQAGLPRDTALRFAAETVAGAASMVRQTGRHPADLKDMVTSPGGTTIAGVAALENGAFRGTVMNAVKAAWQRAKEFGGSG